MTTKKIHVLLADDHTLFRKALRMTLERAPDIEIVAEVVDGQSALKKFRQTSPDVVCMDVNMPGVNGIEATRQMLAINPDAKIIGLSADAEASTVASMIDAGAMGYVIKSGSCAELLKAIHLVSQNLRYISPEVAPGFGG